MRRPHLAGARSGTGARRHPAAALMAALLSLSLLTLTVTACSAEPAPASSPHAAAGPAPAASPSTTATIPGADPLLTAGAHEYSRVGGLVDGFPSAELPVPDGVEVLVSSAVPIGTSGALQVSLNIRSTLPVPELLAIYRNSLTAAGFTEVAPGPGHNGLAAETTFTRSDGDELLVIGVLDDGSQRTVTIGGRLHRDA